MKTIRVKTDLQCPFCGYCKVIRCDASHYFVKCRECSQKVFLRQVDGSNSDANGFYFTAYEPYRINSINREFQDVFVEDYSYWLR